MCSLATIGIQVQNTKYNNTFLVSTVPFFFLMLLKFHDVEMETHLLVTWGGQITSPKMLKVGPKFFFGALTPSIKRA
jgi:hypothetical protein